MFIICQESRGIIRVVPDMRYEDDMCLKMTAVAFLIFSSVWRPSATKRVFIIRRPMAMGYPFIPLFLIDRQDHLNHGILLHWASGSRAG